MGSNIEVAAFDIIKCSKHGKSLTDETFYCIDQAIAWVNDAQIAADRVGNPSQVSYRVVPLSNTIYRSTSLIKNNKYKPSDSSGTILVKLPFNYNGACRISFLGGVYCFGVFSNYQEAFTAAKYLVSLDDRASVTLSVSYDDEITHDNSESFINQIRWQ